MRKVIIRVSYDYDYLTSDYRLSQAYMELDDQSKLHAIKGLIEDLLQEKLFLTSQLSASQDNS
jgi:hypothetical protein